MTAANCFERCVAWPESHMTFNMNVATFAPVIYRDGSPCSAASAAFSSLR